MGSQSTSITSSSFHDCKSFCMSVNNAIGLTVNNNVFFNGRVFHAKAEMVNHFTFNNNLMIGVTRRPTLPINELISCLSIYEAIHDNGVSIKNNICQGSALHGFVLPHIPCDRLSSPPYSNNMAGSTGVAFIFNKVPGNCMGITGVRAYASGIGQIASPAGNSQVIFENFIVADCGRAATLRFGREGTDNTAYFRNSFITAISRP